MANPEWDNYNPKFIGDAKRITELETEIKKLKEQVWEKQQERFTTVRELRGRIGELENIIKQIKDQGRKWLGLAGWLEMAGINDLAKVEAETLGKCFRELFSILEKEKI